MSLSAQINDCIDAVVDWSELIYSGIILGKKSLSDFDAYITTYKDASNWIKVAHIKRECEYAGHSSTSVDNAVKAFLTGLPMFSSYKVPKTGPGEFFDIGYAHVIHGFRWSAELAYEQTKWDKNSCYNGFHAVITDFGDAFYRCNPDTLDADKNSGGRMYEKNHLSNCLLALWLGSGVAGAKTDIEQCWAWMQNHWLTTHYTYAISWNDWVWDGPADLCQVFGKLYLENSRVLTNFSRLFTHLGPGYVDEKHSSKHFRLNGTIYQVVVHHNPSTSERRSAGQGLAYIVMHQCYRNMTSTQKSKFQDMILGTTGDTAWEAFKETLPGLFNPPTNQWRWDSGDPLTDIATARDSVLLMLMGICPLTGGLAIPLRTKTLGSIHAIGPKSFRWDSTNYKIRIPVFAGELTFIYGTTPVTYDFPIRGIYEVTFASNYNSITDVTRLSDLLSDEYYLDTYKISGVTRDSDGVALGSCTVQLFRTSDNVFIAETESDVNGNYSFNVYDNTTQHFVKAHKDGSPNVFGVSDRNLIGSGS